MKRTYVESINELPPFFNPKNADDWNYDPDLGALMNQAFDWRKRYDIKSGGNRNAPDFDLLIIDANRDFLHPNGSLYVAGQSGRGATDDAIRTCEFIYRWSNLLKNIRRTFDTHLAYQIFTGVFFIGADAKPLAAHTKVIVKDGKLVNVTPVGDFIQWTKPNPRIAWWLCEGNTVWLEKQVIHYCEELARMGKYELYIWPPHCVLGNSGHALLGIIQEACFFHYYLRGGQSWNELKGDHPLSENYSVLMPEVLTRWDGKPLPDATKNTEFIQTLLGTRHLIICGEAGSHCVPWTIYNLRDEIASVDPELAKRVYILEDCISPVVVRDGSGNIIVDFTDAMEKALADFRAAGMHVVKSTDDIHDWPGVELS